MGRGATGRNASAVMLLARGGVHGVGVRVPSSAVLVCLARVSGEAPPPPLRSSSRARVTSTTQTGRERPTACPPSVRGWPRQRQRGHGVMAGPHHRSGDGPAQGAARSTGNGIRPMSHVVKSHPDFGTRFPRPDAGLAGKRFTGFGVERAGDGGAISHQDAMSQGGRNVGPFVRDESGVAHDGALAWNADGHMSRSRQQAGQEAGRRTGTRAAAGIGRKGRGQQGR